MFFSTFPPPTEKTKIQSSVLRLLPLSQFTKTVSHPSSLTLAVNSETLSVGVYDSIPAIFLKSFTACEALPAPPPTPRKNNLPLRSFNFNKMLIAFSISLLSIFKVISTTSDKYNSM